MTRIGRRTPAALLCFGTALILSVGPASAWTISGHVTNSNGQNAVDVDLDFEDRSTGTILDTPGDRTDAFGNYSVTVPTGDYRIYFNATPASHLFDGSVDATITSDRTIDMVLNVGTYVSGDVVDMDGFGLAFVDLNFYDVSSGANLGYAGDDSDAFGNFAVLVDPGLTFDILFRPAIGDPHCARQIENVAVGTSDIVLPPVVLESGAFVSGSVHRTDNGNPVVDADIDATNTLTGERRTRLGLDNTDGSGAFQVVLPAGTWDITATPPAGQGLAAEIVPAVVVSGSVSTGTIQLPVGYSITGTVLGPGNAPQSDANVDPVHVVRRIEMPTSGDHTTPSGQYAMILAAATYDFLVWPPPGAPLAVGVLRNRSVTGAATLPTVNLSGGVVIQGTAKTPSGLPVRDADINAEQLADAFVYPTRDDNTNGSGVYAIRVPAGSYRLIARPPVGSGLVADTVVVAATSNQTVHFTFGVTTPSGVGDSRPPSRLALATEHDIAAGAVAFRFSLPPGQAMPTTLRIYSADGRLRRTLIDEVMDGGSHLTRWDGRDGSGRRLPSGMYFVRLASASDAVNARAVLVE
ncbi:MAG: hypothetical protein SGI90_07655 [Candidatus Eisenbacteria bacterium]|nr:hypothetical protein [Candidatus Eisenbacteria bacterium]